MIVDTSAVAPSPPAPTQGSTLNGFAFDAKKLRATADQPANTRPSVPPTAARHREINRDSELESALLAKLQEKPGAAHSARDLAAALDHHEGVVLDSLFRMLSDGLLRYERSVYGPSFWSTLQRTPVPRDTPWWDRPAPGGLAG